MYNTLLRIASASPLLRGPLRKCAGRNGESDASNGDPKDAPVTKPNCGNSGNTKLHDTCHDADPVNCIVAGIASLGGFGPVD